MQRFERIHREEIQKLIDLIAATKQFQTMLSITSHITSDEGWSLTVDCYQDGYHLKFLGTRSGCTKFIAYTNHGFEIIRKPLHIERYATLTARGNGTEVQDLFSDYKRFDGQNPDRVAMWGF
jgi:hypothetical protein